MSVNEYVTYDDLKTYLGITGTGDDALLKRICTGASHIWDTLARRRFYEEQATKYFNFQTAYELFVAPEDLLSVTTLTNGDGNAISSSDFYLYPLNRYPKLWIEIARSSGTYFTYSTTRQRAISVAGLWGWHNDYDHAWEDSGDTVQDDPLGAAATSLNVSDGDNFQVQQMVKIESEQVYITAIAGNALTVERGKNGTTAAEHAQGAAISIWQPAYDVEHWALRLAAWLYRQKDAPFMKVGFPQMGVVAVPASLPPDIREAALRYRRVRV